MANFVECEKQVIEKLITVLSQSLNCYSTGNNESEVIVVEKVLQILLSQNESLYDSQDGSNNRGVMRSISANQEFAPSGENSTNIMLTYGDGELLPAISEGVETTGDRLGSTGTNKLHQLEIIKVFVLIFVISIILLTTCRMVFQLFIRFRPEKPPLA